MIGDPSGKTDMRKMMTTETIDRNVECIKKQMSRFLDFSEGKALIVAPKSIYNMKTLTKDQNTLSLLYQDGNRDARWIWGFIRDIHTSSNRDE